MEMGGEFKRVPSNFYSFLLFRMHFSPTTAAMSSLSNSLVLCKSACGSTNIFFRRHKDGTLGPDLMCFSSSSNNKNLPSF